MANYLNLGKIVNTNGIKGEIRVQSTTNKPEERYVRGAELFVDLGDGNYEKVTVKSHRKHKLFDLLTFKEFDSINDVERFKTKMLKIEESHLPELDEGEYYEKDLVGLTVMNKADEEIGRLKEILYLPANDVWVVSRPGKKDLLLPVIESVILNVDLEQEIVLVHVLEGLDEDED